MDVDVLIVGLGPAGSTVLTNLAQSVCSEFKVLAIDYRPQPGFPVQCGEFMPSPGEMAQLMPDVPNGQKFFTFSKQFISTRTNHISFHSPKGKIIRTPFEGYTLHRGRWNAHLIEVGEQFGAEVWTSACATNMEKGKVTIIQDNEESIQVEPRVIVGADGVNSRIAQWTGMNERRKDNHYVVVKQHLMTGIGSDYDPTDVQMFFGEKYAPGAFGWVIPKSDASANVGTGVRLPMLKGEMNVSKALSNLIDKHPTVSHILNGAYIDKTIAGVVPVGLPLQNTVDLNTKTLLVGDAACQVVSSVGGGIPPSMVAGSIAANAIARFLLDGTSLMNYQSEWQHQMQKMFVNAYKLRQFFDRISMGRDSRIQWYLNHLSSTDLNKVVHCTIPWKLSFASPFVRFLNCFIT